MSLGTKRLGDVIISSTSSLFPFHFPVITSSEITYLTPQLMWKAQLSTKQARISDKSQFAPTFSRQIKNIEQANEQALRLKNHWSVDK